MRRRRRAVAHRSRRRKGDVRPCKRLRKRSRRAVRRSRHNGCRPRRVDDVIERSSRCGTRACPRSCRHSARASRRRQHRRRTRPSPRSAAAPSRGSGSTASTGSWTGTKPISYAYQWVRCGADGGQPDGGNCAIVSGATDDRYRLVSADVGFRMRVRVTATNADGSRTVASNPTNVVVGPPVNTSTPLVRGTMVRLGRDGRSGVVERRPVDLVLVPLAALQLARGGVRLDRRATGRTYRLTSADVNHKIRFNVTARNSRRLDDRPVRRVGDRHGAAPGGAIKLPSGEISIPATSVPSNQRLVVSQVQFSPSRVTSQHASRSPCACA